MRSAAPGAARKPARACRPSSRPLRACSLPLSNERRQQHEPPKDRSPEGRRVRLQRPGRREIPRRLWHNGAEGPTIEEPDVRARRRRGVPVRGSAALMREKPAAPLALPGAGPPPRARRLVMSNWEEREDTTIYKVVVNHEEQYSIWPAHRENPLGWNDVGKSGPKDECLAYIKEVWTDMRPLSLRKKMEEMERERQASEGTN